MNKNKNRLKKLIFAKKWLVPKFIIFLYRNFILLNWVNKDLASPFITPTYLKQKILLRHSIKNASWIETGTYIGETTEFLARRFPIVHTIEPSDVCLKIAKANLGKLNNIVYHFGTSEEKLLSILNNLSGNLCIWLDGHFSGGITFCGENDSPIFNELENISDNKNRFSNLVIFIDDISAGFTDNNNYPSIDFYVDWARKNNFNWFIEQGIFIIKSKNLRIY